MACFAIPALLRPEWDEAAADLKRYARIGAIDVERGERASERAAI